MLKWIFYSDLNSLTLCFPNLFIEQSVVAECALQLRALGDLLNWKYVLLEFLVRTLQAASDNPPSGT